MESSTAQRSLEDLAREAFAAVDRHDLEAASAVWGPESVDHFLPVGEFRGSEALAGYFAGMLAAVPDLRIEVERILVDEPCTTVQWHVRGTFTGEPFLGIEATGRPIDFRGVDVIEWNDQGQIVLNTIYYDGAEFARQVGLLPARDSAADRAVIAAFNGATKLRRTIAARRSG